MRELGWVDGQNISIERRSAEGRPDRLLPLIQEMMTLKVDVIVVSGVLSLVASAQRANQTTPIVMAGLGGGVSRRHGRCDLTWTHRSYKPQGLLRSTPVNVSGTVNGSTDGTVRSETPP